MASARLQGLPSRIRFLVGRLGFKDLDPSRLAAAWADQLSSRPDSTRSELLAIARKLSRAIERDEGPIGHWKRALLARLEPTLATRDTVESFHSDTSNSERQTHLELKALVTDWPRRLLEHPEWAYAEAPLPDMQPLPLDDVWVELRLAEPETVERVRRDTPLREALDQRYEEQHWRARPLEFTIERFEGSAVLVGPPGSGKTTLLKWIARWLIRHPDGRFLLPLLVPLRSYGLWRVEHPGSNLLDFALFKAGVREQGQRNLWSNVLSYLSGPQRDNVLLLLDGWDEVRLEDREAVRQDIDNHLHGFAIIITSRPSGHPRKLPVYDLFEITELSPGSTDTLIRRWFERAEAPRLAEDLKAQLDRSLDLRRMARNPFLLSLLCGLYWHSGGKGPRELPNSRAALYKSALSLILTHHDERYPERRFGMIEQRQVERLALWLFDEAPEAPQLVFGKDDVAACCDHPQFLDDYLKPSRLLGQLGLSDDSHHFLHTTFQEYLAARALTHKEPEDVVETIRQHAHDASWLEILHFLSGLSSFARVVFWQEMTRIAAEPDRYGHIFLRLASFAAEARLTQGGLEELGVDLRDELWKGVINSTFSSRFVDALATLDGPDLARRIKETLADDEKYGNRTLRNLGRLHAPEASGWIVEQLLEGHPIRFEEALEQLRGPGHLHPESLAKLRQAAFAPSSNAHTRRNVIFALSELHDVGSIPEMMEVAHQHPDEAEEILSALGWMGGEQATEALRVMADWRADLEWQKIIVTMLGLAATPAARDLLLERLALLDLEDPLLPVVLEALHGIPVSDGAELILAVLGDELPVASRAAAAHALQEATGPDVVDALARAAGGDPSEEVRCAALQSLDGRGQPNEVGWLKSRISDSTRTEKERTLALRALLTTAQRFAHSSDGRWLTAQAATAVLQVLEAPVPEELVRTAAELAYLAGDLVAPRLIEVALDSSFHWKARCGACFSLGRLRFVGASDSLAVLVRLGASARPRDRRLGAMGPWVEESPLRWDVKEDQLFLPPQTIRMPGLEHTIGLAAADALAWIDPSTLLDIPGTTADNALAAWAFETGSLVFKNYILGANGKVIARSGSLFDATSRALWPSRVPDLKLVIRARVVGDRHELSFALTPKDPSLGMVGDEFGPVVLGRDPEAYRLDLIEDVEGLLSDTAESQAISIDRLRAKGMALFGLLPLGVQMWLWTLRKRIKTLQLFSDELFLPWEMLWLDSQGADRGNHGKFLAETFAITRWRHGTAEQLSFELSHVAVVGSEADEDTEVRDELQDILELFGTERVTVIPPRHQAVRTALESGEFDGWHFIGHASVHSEDADLWEIVLEDGQTLRPEELRDLRGFGLRRPWVFLNGCTTGLTGRSLKGPGGWALQSLECGAGAFLGTHWAVPGNEARRFALNVYRRFLAGDPLGEAVLKARLKSKKDHPGSPTWLAYTAYGHPLAVCGAPRPSVPPALKRLGRGGRP